MTRHPTETRSKRLPAALLAGICLLGLGRAYAAAPPCRYTVVSNGPDGGTVEPIVQDKVTGLMWQQTVPANPCPSDGAGVCTWPDAQAYCAALSYGGLSTGWRLPTVNELQSIVDFSQYNPAIDGTGFPGSAANLFWTNTPAQGDAGTGLAWSIWFYDGSAGANSTGNGYSVRCVH